MYIPSSNHILELEVSGFFQRQKLFPKGLKLFGTVESTLSKPSMKLRLKSWFVNYIGLYIQYSWIFSMITDPV